MPSLIPPWLARQFTLDDVPRNWRAWLAAPMGAVLRSPVPAHAAPARLRTLDAAALVALDRQLRRDRWPVDPLCVPRHDALLKLAGDAADIEPFLFALGCHANGFLRHRALERIEATPGRLALALALLRCEDWVPQVQDIALRVLAHLLESDDVRVHLFDFLDALLALRERTRMATAWPALVEPALLHPGQAEARWHATTHGRPQARRFAFELVMRADPSRRHDAIVHALADADPSLARWAIAQAIAHLPPSEALDVIRTGLMHPHVSVRAESLRRHAELDPANSRALVEAALFDRSAAVRNAAAYRVRTLYAQDPLARWRNVLDAAQHPRAVFALLALAEHAQADDAARIVRWLSHASADLRTAALRALVRANPPDLTDRLQAALSDRSAKVVRQVLRASRQHAGVVSAASLAAARAGSHATRATLARATPLLGKWDALALLLQWFVDAGPDDLPVVAEELRRWLRTENTRFTPLGAAGRADLQAALAAARAVAPERPRVGWERIEMALRHGG